ncbi:hypothetical protein [Anatilimnocola floriformis]|uniref:hypothetical protein n=1 Tax=Anatilimnocola floriformis TaxID=2948575 RepID=UPI0020C1DDC0|nr:hypothetical protein [Anatilimnocola floriformis]
MLRIVKLTSVTLSLAAVMIAAVGCGQSAAPPAQRLPGKWYGKVVLEKETIGNTLTPAQIANLQKMEMAIEFTKDGVMDSSGVENNVPYKSAGKWQFVSQEGDVLNINAIEANGQQKPAILVFEGNDNFTIPLKTEVANIGGMKFERVR